MVVVIRMAVEVRAVAVCARGSYLFLAEKCLPFKGTLYERLSRSKYY